MAKEIMRRRAADNRYLHKDFHGALSVGLDYLRDQYGEQAVRDYLRQFARRFYAPLTEQLKQRGLPALKEHFESVYRDEEGDVRFTLNDDELIVDVAACPAVMHMRASGYAVSPLFHETSATVNRAICEETDFDAELCDYDEETGRARQRFFRRTT